jgi:hypothetical protein
VVDVLNEMLINGVKKYAIAELGGGERAFLQIK